VQFYWAVSVIPGRQNVKIQVRAVQKKKQTDKNRTNKQESKVLVYNTTYNKDSTTNTEQPGTGSGSGTDTGTGSDEDSEDEAAFC